MSANVKYNHLVFPHRFSSGECLFVYSAGDNSVVSLIYTTSESTDITVAYRTDENVVDTIGDDMLEAM